MEPRARVAFAGGQFKFNNDRSKARFCCGLLSLNIIVCNMFLFVSRFDRFVQDNPVVIFLAVLLAFRLCCFICLYCIGVSVPYPLDVEFDCIGS